MYDTHPNCLMAISRLDLGLDVCVSLIPKLKFVVIDFCRTELLLNFFNLTLIFPQNKKCEYILFWKGTSLN
jgi:hypothetical protein